MPELFRRLVELGDSPVALCARFMIALALRPGEARGVTFSMIDEAGTLTLPITKSGRPFIAPLNPAALAVVDCG